jgi:catechol 2,3-dioxygenase-like lactoylglutathione lyase family enzyme
MRTAILAIAAALLAIGAAAQPAQPLVHFHHVHVNSLDPELAIQWYTKHFECERAKFGGEDALWTGRAWILFHKVDQMPPWKITTALYHIGWGATDPKADYHRFVDMGARIQSPLMDLGEGLPLPLGQRFFMYLWGPDNVMIEDITAAANGFNHVHLLSEDPVAAGEWYAREFGFPRRAVPASRVPRYFNGNQIGPTSSFNIDNVNVPIFPMQLARDLFPADWQGREHPESPQGHALDHFAFSCDNLDVMMARFKKDGVTILEEPHTTYGGAMRSAMIEGPDRVRIEIVEGGAKK